MKSFILLLVICSVWIVSVLGASRHVSHKGDGLSSSGSEGMEPLEGDALEAQTAINNGDLAEHRALEQIRLGNYRGGIALLVKSVEYFTHAAEHRMTLAAASGHASDFYRVAILYSRAASILAAAENTERAALVHEMTVLARVGGKEQAFFTDILRDYADMGRQREQSSMHVQAALNFHEAAERFRAVGDHRRAGLMAQDEAHHFEASAAFSVQSGDRLEAATSFRGAAAALTLLGSDRAATLWALAAQYARLYAVDRQADEDHDSAAIYFRYSAQASTRVGETADATMAWTHSAAEFALSAAAHMAQGNNGLAAEAYGNSADAFTEAGSTDLASAMRAMAGELQDAE